MESWLKISLVLCSYGFFKELRPSEPYLTEYLLGPQKNLTANEINYEIYPVWTYAYLSLLVVVFLVTDFLRYKPVIIFEGFGYVATWCLLLWAPGVKSMQFMEFCYGIATSTEVAYYTYIYAQVEDKYYQRVTSYTRAAILSGKFFSGLLSQLLTSFGIMNYYNLNYFSLASVSIALCIAFMLPPARRSIYFHREEAKSVASSKSQIEKRTIDIFSVEQEVHDDQEQRNQTRVRKWKISDIKQAFYLLWLDFRDAYTNIYLLKWSIWWAFATCINFQVGNYIQPLWEDISSFKTTDDLYNGSVEAATTLFGALASLTVGYLFFNWKLIGELTLSVISLIDGLLLYFMGKTSYLWVGYVNYILFRVSYQVLITVASYQVAKELKADSYGLVFGINMFVALCIQSILTVIVVEYFELQPGLQFQVYGYYFICLSLLFLVFSLITFHSLGFKGIKRERLWRNTTFDEEKKSNANS